MVLCVQTPLEETWRRAGVPLGRKTRSALLCRHHPYLYTKISKSKPDIYERKEPVFLTYAVSPYLTSVLESYAPEFIAQVVYWIWFGMDLNKMGVSRESLMAQGCRTLFSKTGFLSWNRDVLSNLRVSKNVIFLALLFIYRLKEQNPAIEGKPGSEYRLLTIALMLGNKFLDDNTYTNKTWADITGICVREIHVMETEFLINIRYSLLVSKLQWEEWQMVLERLWTYSLGLMKMQFSLRNVLSTRIAPENELAYINNNKSCSRWILAASTQIVSLVPPYACLKESPFGLKYISHTSNTSQIPSVMQVLPNCIRTSCTQS